MHGVPSCWPVNVASTQAQFLAADTDQDGLVSGGDVMQLLLSSGLPQVLLGRIWALVDIHKNGKLNAEQFALM